jgi:hypothetical protein
LCLKNLEGTGLYVSPNKSSDFCWKEDRYRINCRANV